MYTRALHGLTCKRGPGHDCPADRLMSNASGQIHILLGIESITTLRQGSGVY